MHDGISLITGWDSFYVIVGSSSAALTGLMFVVVTLIPEARMNGAEDGVAAYATPTVVHFCGALLVSAMLTAPWSGLAQVATAMAVTGMAGVVYEVMVLRRTLRQTSYRPVLSDWIWHTVLPFAAYVTLMIAGATLTRAARGALFAIGAATLLLLYIGIHNAWDTVTYMALARAREQPPGR